MSEPISAVAQHPTVHIEMLGPGQFRFTFPDDPIVALGMMEIAKDIFLTNMHKRSDRLVQTAGGPLSFPNGRKD